MMEQAELSYDVLKKRAENLEKMFKALQVSHPWQIHEIGRRCMHLMWRAGWYTKDNIPEEKLKGWKDTIEYNERFLERLARDGWNKTFGLKDET